MVADGITNVFKWINCFRKLIIYYNFHSTVFGKFIFLRSKRIAKVNLLEEKEVVKQIGSQFSKFVPV